eukprot:6606724-Ditylum_brightwellii.AAC.1
MAALPHKQHYEHISSHAITNTAPRLHSPCPTPPWSNPPYPALRSVKLTGQQLLPPGKIMIVGQILPWILTHYGA